MVGNPEVGNKQAPGKSESSSALSFRPAKKHEQKSAQNAGERGVSLIGGTTKAETSNGV